MGIYIWLVPEKEERNYFQGIVDKLAKKYGACSFIPHITLYGFRDVTDPHDIVEFSRNIALKPFGLKPLEIKHSDKLTQTLFIRMEITYELESNYLLYKSKFITDYPNELNPHLSLMYKNRMESEDKEREAADITLPAKITFDTLQVIKRDKGSIKDELDVSEWIKVFERGLQ